jgi:glycosyltransferase involved in cell wall biosynthesis
MGSFDGFNTLSKFKYFCFLYTSQWDGLPNILLEAAASGLPIIAPRIGGITNFLSNGRGFLCSQTNSISEYIEYLNILFGQLQEISCINKMDKYLKDVHSYENFEFELKSSNY